MILVHSDAKAEIRNKLAQECEKAGVKIVEPPWRDFKFALNLQPVSIIIYRMFMLQQVRRIYIN